VLRFAQMTNRARRRYSQSQSEARLFGSFAPPGSVANGCPSV